MSFGTQLPPPHAHVPSQHRDGKEPWCNECGLNVHYEKPKSHFKTVRLDDGNWDEDYLRKQYPILRFFEYAHLPTELAEVSVQFWKLAYFTASLGPGKEEIAAALRKLLEAKDAAVRAMVPLDNSL